MSTDNLNFHINRLDGIVMILNETNTKFKVYRSVEESNVDKNFINPIKISEYKQDLLLILLTQEDYPDARYNCSRIIYAYLINELYSETEEKEIMSAVRKQFEKEKNIRVKALIANVLHKKLEITSVSLIEYLIEAFNQEKDRFWKFELLIILLTKKLSNESEEILVTSFKKEYESTKDEKELIGKILLRNKIKRFFIDTEDEYQISPESNTIKPDSESVFEILKSMTDLDTKNPKEILARTGLWFNCYNEGGLKYDEMLDGINRLEQMIGEIPVFSVSEQLPEKEQNHRYEYLVYELLIMNFDSFQQLIAFGLNNFLKSIPNFPIFEDIKVLIRNSSNEGLVTRYCREWEIQFANLIDPIFKHLESKKLLPEVFEYEGRQSKIDAVREFVKQEDGLEIFDFLTNPLDAHLRNSLVHYNYYFVKNGEELVYYNYYKRKLTINRISTEDFESKVMHLLIHRNIFTVRIAQKLCEELGIEWIRREYNDSKENGATEGI